MQTMRIHRRGAPALTDTSPAPACPGHRAIKPIRLLCAAAGLAAVLSTAGGALAAGDAEHGRALYQGCEDCHSIEENDVGPRHKGVFGRTAGTQPDYAYSKALKQSGLVWNEANLDRWLTNPQALVPGARMYYHLADPKDRADIIAFLKEHAK